jgi:hypothetical protein
MDGQPSASLAGGAVVEGEEPHGDGDETLAVSERAAMELLAPLEKVLMASLLDLGWKVSS